MPVVLGCVLRGNLSQGPQTSMRDLGRIRVAGVRDSGCEDSGGGCRSLSGQIQDGGTEHHPMALAGQPSWPSTPGWSARPGARVHFRCVATGPSRLGKCRVLPSVASQCSPGSLQRPGQSSGPGLGSSLHRGTIPGWAWEAGAERRWGVTRKAAEQGRGAKRTLQVPGRTASSPGRVPDAELLG